MSLDIVPISQVCGEQLFDFVRKTFKGRPDSSQFLRWRYLECPNQRGFLAIQDGDGVAMLGAFSKTYRYQSQDFPCLEPNEWFYLPSLRGSGIIGLILMQHMLRLPGLKIAVGGSPDTRNLLPKLHWKEQHAIRFVLPLGSSVAAHFLARRFGAPHLLGRSVGVAASVYFRPREIKRPRNWSAIPVACIGSEVRSLYASPEEMVQLPDIAFVQWLSRGFPGTGHFTTLYFVESGRLRGWSLSRVFESDNGRIATILEIFGVGMNEHLYTWMISETVMAVSGLSPSRIIALASEPDLKAAFRANRFLRAETVPVWIHQQEGMAVPTVRTSLLWGDECLRPYPVTWGF